MIAYLLAEAVVWEVAGTVAQLKLHAFSRCPKGDHTGNDLIIEGGESYRQDMGPIHLAQMRPLLQVESMLQSMTKTSQAKTCRPHAICMLHT